MSRPFAVIGFTVFFTIALLYNTETGVTAAALAAYAAALVVTLFVGKARKQRIFPCAFASGAVACALLLSSINFSYLPVVAYDGKTCDVTAVLTSEPELEYGNYYYTAKATSVDGEEVDLNMRLTFSGVPEAEPYDYVSGKFTFYVLGSSSEEFLASHKANGVFVGAYPVSDNYTVVNVPEAEKPLGKTVIDIRKAIRNTVYRILPDERGALAVALMIGDKSGLSSATLNDFRTAGISHVICVSGFHLSLWSMLILELFRKLRLGERLASFFSIFVVVAFMLVSGLTYSVVRSGIMMLVYLLANILMRKRDSLNSLGFALTVIAVFNPFAMGSVSLQLSALATLGIILYSQYAAPRIKLNFQKISIKPIRYVLQSVFSTLMLTVSATAFTLPVSLSLYNGFNFAVFAANLVAVPIAGYCMVLCAIGALLGCFSTAIFNLPAAVGGAFAKFLIWFSGKVADIGWLSFKIESDESAIVICVIFAICILSLVFAYYGKPMPCLTTAVCGVVFSALLIFFSVSERGITRIGVADCGNGTAVVVGKGDETLLVGCGGTDFLGSMYIGDRIDAFGGEIDALIIPDKSEYSTSYLNKILSEYSPEKVYCGELPSGSSLLLNNSEKYDLNEMEYNGIFTVRSASVNNRSCVYLRTDDISVLICFDPIPDISAFPEEFCKADVVITRGDYPVGIEGLSCKLVVINAENSRGILIQEELSEMGMNCAATAGCGDIIIKAEDGFVSAYRE